MKFTKQLVEEAKKCEICKPFEAKLAEAKNVDELLGMYVAGIDFCLEKNFPSNEFLVQHAGDKLEGFGIYVDKDIDIEVLQTEKYHTAVLLGNTQANLNYKGCSASQVFVKHNSKANINIGENAFLVVDCFDDSETSIIAYGDATVTVNIYKGAKFTTACVNNAKIIENIKDKISY